jgi:hypothetical protein
MSCQGLYTVSDVSKLIETGRVLLVAGNEDLLRQLPKGTWIGGTSTNFMATAGGLTARDMVFASDITDQVERAEVRSYSASELPHIAADYPGCGFTVLNVPAFSELHSRFAKEVSTYNGVFNSPLYGWISGVDVSEIGKRSPKTFAGDGTPRTEEAAALHVTLPAGKIAKIDIINLFAQGAGAEIEFAADGFESMGDCLIGGKPGNLASYVAANKIDVKLPLVANYQGAMVNVSLRDVDAAAGKATFYAPVFKGVKYKFAAPVADYIDEFTRRLATIETHSIALSCNCVLNYLYAELEGKKTGSIVGPITFGEIAYVLLNQTLVYLSIETIG